MTDEFNGLKERYAGCSMDEKAVSAMKKRIEEAENLNRAERAKKRIRGFAIAAAAAFTVVVLPNTNQGIANAMAGIPGIGGLFRLVTIRDYHDNTGSSQADISVSGIRASGKKGKKTAGEINKEIKELADKYLASYKETVRKGGHEAVDVDTEIIDKTDDYFTLKLSSTESAADSYTENHYYTISLRTGKQIRLIDLFKKGSDYKSVLIKNVEDQMKDQVKDTPDVSYFYTDSREDQELTGFKESDLFDKASFYLNKDGNIVLCYNQGQVAAMYMGDLEFVIPNDNVKDILK